MAQDLRKLFEKERQSNKGTLKEGHKARFVARLEREMPPKKKGSYGFLLAIAACVVLSIGGAIYYFGSLRVGVPGHGTVVDKNGVNEVDTGISLGDLSPDLKKIEDYYVANINLELSHLKISHQNKALVNSYMEQLGTLNEEYKKLNVELNDIGPNDQTITAMIKNLQLRLQLMHKLKEKLNQLKSSKNETVTKTSV
ncbi:hypothetical protein [Pareuzebyella sediminis]|uniref:hypothetical protein n=1 Tax=Pareuzebyella sediminis TaxID=2607998 RepID=UPI0011EE97D2|nr:hypothetical protein [Pareuzebyella sediminis]